MQDSVSLEYTPGIGWLGYSPGMGMDDSTPHCHTPHDVSSTVSPNCQTHELAFRAISSLHLVSKDRLTLEKEGWDMQNARHQPTRRIHKTNAADSAVGRHACGGV